MKEKQFSKLRARTNKNYGNHFFLFLEKSKTVNTQKKRQKSYYLTLTLFHDITLMCLAKINFIITDKINIKILTLENQV